MFMLIATDICPDFVPYKTVDERMFCCFQMEGPILLKVP